MLLGGEATIAWFSVEISTLTEKSKQKIVFENVNKVCLGELLKIRQFRVFWVSETPKAGQPKLVLEKKKQKIVFWDKLWVHSQENLESSIWCPLVNHIRTMFSNGNVSDGPEMTP